MTRLILASASPRRKELLAQAGLSFDVFPVDIDEVPLAKELALDYVSRLAREKAKRAWFLYARSVQGVPVKNAQSSLQNEPEKVVVLASDTSVVLGDTILGKPSDRHDFGRMMRLLSGCQHEVITSVYLIEGEPARNHAVLNASSFTVVTKVNFKVLGDAEIEAYWCSGEPHDKAGGYGIQGKGALFVEGIEGSYSNVVGLPLKETCEHLAKFNIEIW